MPAPPEVLESAEDVGEGGRVLWVVVHGCLGSDTGRLAISTIYNVVVDAVVRHCLFVMVESAEDMGRAWTGG